MEIKFEEKIVKVDGDELKVENVADSNFMIAFIDKVIQTFQDGSLNMDELTETPFQGFVKRLVEDACSEEFIRKVNELGSSKTKADQNYESFKDIDFELPKEN